VNLKSINYWSYAGGLDGSLKVSRFLQLASEHGYDAVELCIGEGGDLHLDSTEAEVHAIRTHAEDLGLSVPSAASGLYWGYSLGDSTAEARQKAKSALEKMVRIASWLGAKTLLTLDLPVGAGVARVTSTWIAGLAARTSHARSGGLHAIVSGPWSSRTRARSAP